ncbi:MAG: hypothetical protein KGJ84_03350 [Elusimicrobia bacterium]|nr:hypothetical protein [Elusimicrobiota bacterium]
MTMSRPGFALAVQRVSRRLKSCREAAGYGSARSFYDSAGGRSVLGCGYETYRRLEQPGRLPKPGTFEKIYEELEHSLEPRQLRTLARAYAQALLGEKMSAWPPGGGAKLVRRHAGLPETPDRLWQETLFDPRDLAAAVALESGQGRARDLPEPASRARRRLGRLVRAGVARRRGGVFFPVARAFPLARSRAPTGRERKAFLDRIFSASHGTAEVVGGATEFVHSNRDDMDEFSRHLWGSAASHVRRTRAEAGRGEPVYLLEIHIREHIPEREDA